MKNMCKCGCGARVPTKNNRGWRQGRFSPGHNWNNAKRNAGKSEQRARDGGEIVVYKKENQNVHRVRPQ